MMRKHFIFLSSLMVLFLSTSLSAEPVNFAPLQNSSLLAGISKQVGSYGNLTYECDYEIREEDCQIFSTHFSNCWHLVIKGASFIPRSGAPALPMVIKKIKLPLGSQVKGVYLTDCEYREINLPGRIIPFPEPVKFSLSAWQERRRPFRFNQQIYQQNTAYPNFFLSYEAGSDGKSNYCLIKIYPAQYFPALGRVILLTRAKIKVKYDLSSSLSGFRFQLNNSYQGVIICPDFLRPTAAKLKNLHESQGVKTEIITTEWIENNYQEAPNPPFRGYAQEQPACIIDYKFSLAKKIVNFLRDTNIHPTLQFVTLLGDGKLVPPSYYVYYPTFGEVEGCREALSWMPTDFFYTSCDYDFVPNFAVGRISITTLEEANRYISKIQKWLEQKNWDWFKKAVLAGGDPFPSYLPYFGELSPISFLNQNFFLKYQVERLFLSDGNFTASTLLQSFREGKKGIINNFNHGSGNAISFADGSVIYASQILTLPEQDKLPLVISPACQNGTFDSRLCPSILVPGGGSFSIGEAILRSPGGGIAYIGDTRGVSTGLFFYFVDGRLFLQGSFGFQQIMENIFRKLSLLTAEISLGEIFKQIQHQFTSSNNMQYPLNYFTILTTHLLSDPVLKLPAPPPLSPNPLPQPVIQFLASPTYRNINSFPVYLEVKEEISVRGENSVLLKLCDNYHAQKFIRKTSSNLLSIPLPKESSFYLLRAENGNQKEEWYYLYLSEGKLVADGDNQDWQRASFSPAAQDPDDFSVQVFELTNLYLYGDRNGYYFGFNTFSNPFSPYYPCFGIGVNCRQGGYSGEKGTSRDAFGNFITFSPQKGIEFEIYIFPMQGILFFEWQENAFNLSKEVKIKSGSSNSFQEVIIPREVLPEGEIEVVCFSSAYAYNMATLNSPAQDAVPSNEGEVYTSPSFDPSFANMLSEFVKCKAFEKSIEKEQFSPPSLSASYPNPFNPECWIPIQNVDPARCLFPQAGIKVKIYNILGQIVREIEYSRVQEFKGSRVYWDGKDSRGLEVPAGVYFYEVGGEGVRRMVVLR
jgi:hypothetical protein